MMVSPQDIDAPALQAPYQAGVSPHRIKGVAYRGHMEYVEENVPGGVEAMVDAMVKSTGDESYRRFFGQPFLPSSRYDVYPLALAGVACAALCGLTFDEFLRIRTAHQARQDLKGVYRFLLKMVSAETIAARLPRLISQYYDYSWAETELESPGVIVGKYRGVPEGLSPWMSRVGEFYVETVLQVAGHPDARVHTGVAEHDEVDPETGEQLLAIPFKIVL